MKAEIALPINDIPERIRRRVTEQLVLSLFWMGYSTYMGIDEDRVCFTVRDDEITKIEENG